MENLTNEYFITSYLEEVGKRSPGSHANNKLALQHFTESIKKPFLDITMIDIQGYLINTIDKKEIKKTTKNTIRYLLRAFFNYIQKTMLLYKFEFNNPVPSKKIYNFTTNLDDIEYVIDSELEVLKIEQLTAILDYCKNNLKLRDFVLIALSMCSGPRISEMRTIRIKDINFEECYFQTGFIPGARKTSLHTNKGLLFFFPKPFVKYIKEYLKSCEKCNMWLFPGYNNKPLSRSGAQKIITEIRESVKFHFTWHYFRRTLITERRKIGCPKELSEGLANHAPSSVQEKSYIKLTIKEKQGYYEQYFPFNSISYFSSSEL